MLGVADAFGKEEQIRCLGVFEVEPVVNFTDRYDERVSRSERVYREKGDGLLVAIHEMGGKFALDDPREDRRHRSKGSGVNQHSSWLQSAPCA